MTNDLKLLSDEGLMERVYKHDHQAFSILVERHNTQFYASAYRIVMNQHTAEDIVQDAFLKLWDNPKVWKKNKGAKFTSWFYKIVINLSTDFYRRNKKTFAVEEEGDFFEVPANQQEDLQNDEQQQALDRALKTLPEKQLMALNLCFYEDKSRKEAADIMDVNIKALESLLMRAKQGLRDDLHRQGVLEENRKGKRA